MPAPHRPQVMMPTGRHGGCPNTRPQGLNLNLSPGRDVGLGQAVRCGQEHIADILGMLMPPSAGSLRMLGEGLTRAFDDELTLVRNCQIGFVSQFHNLLPDFFALQNVMLPRGPRRSGRPPRLGAAVASS